MTLLHKNWLIAAILIIGSFLPYSLHAGSGSTLLFAGDATLSKSVTENLTTGLSLQPTGIETNYDGKVFITDEGARIPFSDLLHGRSLRYSSVLRQLRLEYGPDYVVMAWIAREKTEKHTAYGVSKISVTTRIRVVDIETGKEVADESSSHDTDFALEGSDEDQAKARDTAITNAAQGLNLDELLAAVDQHYAGKEAAQGRIRVVFQNIGQDDYFKQRDALLALVTQAGALGEVRDSYEESQREFTLRATISSDLETFYRSLYASAVDSEAFDHFDISHDQKSVTVRVLPPERKRIVIAGITAENYHTRLHAYRESVVSQPGVKDLGFEYLTDAGAAGPQLIFTFTYGDDLTSLEERIWANLKERGETPNRALLSISDRAIHYRAGSVTGDRIALTIMVNNVAPGDYRKVGTPLDAIIKGLDIQELRKEYDRTGYRLTYRFNTTGTASELDSALWDQIAANDALGDVVQDTTTEQNLGYFYFQKRPETRDIVVTVRTLSPETFRTAGQSLIQIIRAVEGVSKFQQSYSEANQTLVLRFRLQATNAYTVDAAIWDAAAKDDALSNLAMGELDEDELEYFFSGAAGANQRDVIIHLTRVTGQDYKKIATQFSDMLGAVKSVRNVRYRYLLDKRTVVFRLHYEGEGLFALDDALQRSMLANKLFEHVLKGSERLGRLIYIFSSESKESAEEEKPVWTGEDYATGDIKENRLTKLDQTVVYLYVRSEEGDSEGTGFLISASGYILTNAHVVEGGYVYVRTYDGSQYTAKIIKTDPELDLALVRIKSAPRNFAKVAIGNSEEINRGDPITVIGHPLGARFEYSVLTGILSGYNREDGLLQLSVPSYPGISGSPVFDAKGRVVAIMAAIAMAPQSQIVEIEQQLTEISTITTVENIGLAIPINYARNIIALAKP